MTQARAAGVNCMCLQSRLRHEAVERLLKMRFVKLVLPLLFMSACVPLETPRAAQGAAQINAARQVFAAIQPMSLRENVEYCGVIGVNNRGLLAASPAVRGVVDSCEAETPANIITITASYHTHGGFSADYFNELPSMNDVRADLAEGIDGFVATPGGRIWFVDSSDRRITQICGLGCLPQAANFVVGANGPIQQTYSFAELAQKLNQ